MVTYNVVGESEEATQQKETHHWTSTSSKEDSSYLHHGSRHRIADVRYTKAQNSNDNDWEHNKPSIIIGNFNFKK